MTLQDFLTEQIGLSQAEKQRQIADHTASMATLNQRIADLQHMLAAAQAHPQIEATLRGLDSYALLDDAAKEL